MSDKYDIVVIGGGPAGYVAAIRAGQLGFKTACVDQWLNRDGSHAFGGTCLNAGCIPSKALLESSELYERTKHEAEKHGIGVGEVTLDVAKMLERKDGIAKQLTGGVQALFKANKVDGIAGTGTITAKDTVKVTPVTDDGEEQELKAKHIIIASGSTPVELPMAKFDGDKIVDSWGALEFDEVPKRLGVIGAGVIGVELGSVWSRLGSETVLIEAMPDFLPIADAAIAKDAARQFKKQGLDIRLGAKVSKAEVKGDEVVVEYEAKDKTETLTFDKLIVAVGRRPETAKLLDGVDVKLSDRGFVEVDADYKTSVDGIYAVGDVIGGMMLAHKGEEEGVACVEKIHGEKVEVNYETIPSVIYTMPEVAWVGKTEQQCKDEGLDVNIGSFPFAANGRAKAMEQAIGQVKMIADAKTDRILGVHMVGPYVSELVAEMVVAMEFGGTAEDICLIMHAHPTLSEAVHEAAFSVHGRAIHAMNKKR